MRTFTGHWFASWSTTILSIFFSSFAALAVFWAYDSHQEILVVEGWNLRTPHVQQEEFIVVDWKFTKRKSCPGTGSVYLITSDNTRYPLDAFTMTWNPTKKVKAANPGYKVPRKLPDGNYELQVFLKYNCNPLFPIEQVLPRIAVDVYG